MSKAGGLIIAETLACGLPLLMMDVLPAQEKGNMEIIVQRGAGELALTPDDALAVLSRWLADDGALLAECARRGPAARCIRCGRTRVGLACGAHLNARC